MHTIYIVPVSTDRMTTITFSSVQEALLIMHALGNLLSPSSFLMLIFCQPKRSMLRLVIGGLYAHEYLLASAGRSKQNKNDTG